MNEKLKSILNNNYTNQENLEEPIKSLLCKIMNPTDITLKDVKNYCGILYKNNARKWICRLFFNGMKKSIVIHDETKSGVRYYIDTIDYINGFKTELQTSTKKYFEQPIVK